MICGLIAHYVRMLYEGTPTIYSLYIPNNVFHPHFIPISNSNLPGIVFWGPYVTLSISIVFHGAWCKGSCGLEWKNDFPVEKTYGQNKGDNNYWTSRLLFVVFFCGTFFQCSFFWGWRILESIKWQMFSRWPFWSLESLLHCHDVRHNWRSYNPWSRKADPDFCWIVIGGENGWRWKSMKFEIRFLRMRKLGAFV